jgi:hypothetical protein
MEHVTRHPTFDPQHETLQHACREAEGAVAASHDRAAALAARDRVCGTLEEECVSAVVLRGVREFVDRMIADRWPERGPGEAKP